MSDASGESEGPAFEGRLCEDAEASGELVEHPTFEGRLDE